MKASDVGIIVKNSSDETNKIIDANKTILHAVTLNYLNTAQPLLSNIIKASGKILTSEIVSILEQNDFYLMTQKELNSISEYFDIKSDDLIYLIENDVDLISSIVILNAANNKYIAKDKLFELYNYSQDLDEYVELSKKTISLIEQAELTAEESNGLVKAIANGKSIDDCGYALPVACVTGNELENCINDNSNISLISSSTHNSQLSEIALNYKTDIALLEKWLNTNNKSVDFLIEEIEKWQKERNFYYHATKVIQQAQTNGIENRIYNKYKMPGSEDIIDDISVSQIEGIVSYSKDLISLGGQDGLDFNLGLRYDQDDAMQFASLKDIDDMPLKYQFVYVTDWYSVSGDETELVQEDWIIDSELINEPQINEYANRTYFEEVVDDSTHWLYEIKSFKILVVHEGVYEEQTFLRSTFNDNRYHLGYGWAWKLPALEIRTTKKIIHFPDGQKYTLEKNGSVYNLKGYQYEDFIFSETLSSEFVSGTKSAAYKLKYKTGRIDYFDTNGLYLGSLSRDSSPEATSIHVYYDSDNRLSYIIDSVGRKIEFVYRVCSETIPDPEFGDFTLSWEEIDINFYDKNADNSILLMRIRKDYNGWWDPVINTQYYDASLSGITVYEDSNIVKNYTYSYGIVDCDLSYNYVGGLGYEGENYNRGIYDQSHYVLSQIRESDYNNHNEPCSCLTTITYEISWKYISPATAIQYGRVQKVENVEYVTWENQGTEEKRSSKIYGYYQVDTNTNERTNVTFSGSWDSGSGCYWPRNDHIVYQHELIEGDKLTRTYYSNERLVDKIEVYNKNSLATPYSITEITYDNNRNPVVESTRKGTSDEKLWVISRKSYDNYGNILSNAVSTGTEITLNGVDIEPGISFLLESVDTEYGTNKSIPLKITRTSNLIGYEKCYVSVQENFLDKSNNKILSSISYVQNYDDPSDRVYLNKIDYITSNYNVTDTYQLDLTKNSTQALENIKHTSYEYDTKYDVYISKIIENNAVVNSDGTLSDEETLYEYDSFGRVISGGTDENHMVSYDYDALGNILQIENPNGSNTRYNYDYVNKSTEEVAADGSKTKYAYDIFDQLNKEYRYNTTENSYELIREYTYDTRNRIATLTEYTNSQATEYRKVSYTYDFLDRPTNITVTDHNQTLLSKQDLLYGYEEQSGTLYETNTIRTYNGANTYTTKKEYMNASGNLCAVKTEYSPGQYYTDNYYYDNFNRIARCSGDTIDTQNYTYDNVGRIISVSDALNNTVTKEYDGFNRVTQTTDAIGAKTFYSYDALDRVIYEKQEIDDIGEEKYAETWINFDVHGNLIEKKVKSNSLDSENSYQTIRYTYDVADNLIATEQPLNTGTSVFTQYVYDSLNTVRYIYTGLNGLLTLDENGIPNETSSTYSVTEYQYDQYHNISKILSDSKTESYNYDFIGNLISSQVTNSAPIYYTYDMLGRQLTKTSGNLVESVTYNDAGQIATLVDKNGIYTYTYDLMGRVLTEIRDDSSNARDYKLVYTYNSKSQPLTISLQFYNPETNLYEEKDYKTYSYDTLSRLTSLSFKSSVNSNSVSNIEYVYNAISQPVSVTVTGNNQSYQTIYDYNTGGLKTHIEQKTKSGDADYVTQHYENYTYSYNGNLLTKTDNIGNATQYSYDNLNRLISETYSNNSTQRYQITYGYDAFNNRISKIENDVLNQSQEQTTYSYRYGTQLASEIKSTVDGSESFSYNYNSAGDLISKCKIVDGVESVVTSNTYDTFGRLLSTAVTEDGVSTQINYEYDGLNHRISKTTTDDTIYHFWNGNNIVGDLTEDAYQSYVFGVAGIEALATTNSSGNRAVSAYGKNAHGDVIALQSLDGATVGNYEYDAYGNTLSATDGIYNPYGYSGEYYDEETGYYYLKARYYDPTIGSFIQKDTYSGEITSPASLNPYEYCQANPVYYSDPTGHWVETALDVVGLIADAYDFYKKPNLLNGAFLLWSVASVVVPILPGSYVGRATKAISKLDDVADTYRAVKRTVNAVDRGADVAKTIKKTVSVADKAKDLGKATVKYIDDALEIASKKAAKESAEKAHKQLVKKTQEAASELIQKISKNAKKVDVELKKGFDASSLPTQIHHFATDKSSKYTSQFNEIVRKYNLDLDGDWNKAAMNHLGRHPNDYHEFVLESMRQIDIFANGDVRTFLSGFESVKETILANPTMLRKAFWKGRK